MKTSEARKRKQRVSDLPDAAVTYLRVSTKKQLYTAIDLDPDGNSISTQRDYTSRKADSYEVPVDREFIEPGNSAKTLMDRPVFRELLQYVTDNPQIKYVIVYMRSRAFRNHIDAAIVGRQLEKLGVRLVSAKEDFGEGPNAVAMEAMLDVMNGWTNTIQGIDISTKMQRKAAAGGTLGRAPLGYRNVTREHEGRRINTVAVDDVRAPLVRTSFELYATGDYTLERLEATMADRGLTAPAFGKLPERPVTAKWLHRLLQDTYYIGEVVYKGETFDGRHEAIISRELFRQVQDVRHQRSSSGQRDRIHHHYLKGMLFCDRCARHERTSRLVYTQVTGRGGTYQYYFCRGRQEGLCDLPFLPVTDVEDAIVRHYRTLPLAPDFIDEVQTTLATGVAREQSSTHQLHTRLQQTLKELDSKEERLIDLAADGTIPQAKIRTRLREIQADREHATASLQDTTGELELGREVLHRAIEQLRRPDELYRGADDTTRRFMNETFYDAFYLEQDGVQAATLSEPFADFHRALAVHRNGTVMMPHNAKSPHLVGALSTNKCSEASLASVMSDSGSSNDTLVPPMGFEPTLPP